MGSSGRLPKELLAELFLLYLDYLDLADEILRFFPGDESREFLLCILPGILRYLSPGDDESFLNGATFLPASNSRVFFKAYLYSFSSSFL